MRLGMGGRSTTVDPVEHIEATLRLSYNVANQARSIDAENQFEPG